MTVRQYVHNLCITFCKDCLQCCFYACTWQDCYVISARTWPGLSLIPAVKPLFGCYASGFDIVITVKSSSGISAEFVFFNVTKKLFINVLQSYNTWIAICWLKFCFQNIFSGIWFGNICVEGWVWLGWRGWSGQAKHFNLIRFATPPPPPPSRVSHPLPS